MDNDHLSVISCSMAAYLMSLFYSSRLKPSRWTIIQNDSTAKSQVNLS